MWAHNVSFLVAIFLVLNSGPSESFPSKGEKTKVTSVKGDDSRLLSGLLGPLFGGQPKLVIDTSSDALQLETGPLLGFVQPDPTKPAKLVVNEGLEKFFNITYKTLTDPKVLENIRPGLEVKLLIGLESLTKGGRNFVVYVDYVYLDAAGNPDQTRTTFHVVEVEIKRQNLATAIFGDKYTVSDTSNPFNNFGRVKGFLTPQAIRNKLSPGQNFAIGVADGAKIAFGLSEKAMDILVMALGGGENQVSNAHGFLDDIVHLSYDLVGSAGGVVFDLAGDITGIRRELNQIAYLAGFAGGIAGGIEATKVADPLYGIKGAAVLLGLEPLLGMRKKAPNLVIGPANNVNALGIHPGQGKR